MADISESNLPLVHKDTQPIGIFDSGVGGLTVWTEIRKQLPLESTVYYADQAHVPYGKRSLSEVRGYAFGITKFLLQKGAKIIVIACNTASGAALQALRSVFVNIDFVGMEPAVKPAVENTVTGHVGVIATQTTFQAPLYQHLIHRYGREVVIHTQICPGLVEAIEIGDLDKPSTTSLIQNCLEPLLAFKIDQLVLGCTHYPFIIPIAQRIVGDLVTLIDPAPAVARQTRRLLDKKSILQTASLVTDHHFYTSGSNVKMQKIAGKLVGYTGQVVSTTWDGNSINIKNTQF